MIYAVNTKPGELRLCPVSYHTLYRLRKEGKIKFVKIGGRQCVTEEELLKASII